MKTRESGMPDEKMWASFFSPAQTLAKLGLTGSCHDVVDFGCGYGTFTIPAAQIIAGVVHAMDIDPEMIAATKAKVEMAHLLNVRLQLRDFVSEGTGLPDGSVGYAMLFNILHAEQPLLLLREPKRILKPDGLLAVMHWNYDPHTPRGPSMDIRPRPEMCRAWAIDAGFDLAGLEQIELPPHHYGIVFRPTRDSNSNARAGQSK